MEVVDNVLKFVLVMGFVFMSTPFLAFILIGVGTFFPKKAHRTLIRLGWIWGFLK
jgi:hypothetical protein